jgi:type 1 fimbriae regulatory protein FimB
VLPLSLQQSCGFSLAHRGYDLRLIQHYLGRRDPKHTVHYTRVAAGRFESLWR